MAKKLVSGEGWKVSYANEKLEVLEIISKPPEKQKVKIALEKRNKGKVVTVISNLVLSEKDLQELTKMLKVTCGTGGSINKSNIEIQGEQVEKIKAWFIANKWGFR